MTTDDIMSYRRAVPFRPFELHLKDGRKFIVKDFIHIGRDETGSTIIVAAPDESFEHFAPQNVAAIKVLTTRGRGGKRA